jgi:hypothetical protein
MGYSKITAFPGCSSVPAGTGENNFCEPPPSSSAAESSSSSPSSSSAGHSSSSEDMEDAECYANATEANAIYDGKIWQCIQAGKIPNFRMERGCIDGGCEERSSSSLSSNSEEASSSSSGNGGSDVCQASPALKSLRKDADIYDDWVYIGRQPYVTTTERRNFPRYPGMYFDALGRIYFGDKPPDRYYYYIDGNKIYKPRTVEEYSEFEVWVKNTTDLEGNRIQIFSMEDSLAGLRRDSIFYHSGYWEVFEMNEMSNETSLKVSSGARSLRRYDSEYRLMENYLINGKGDTLISEQYEWKNGRLVRMVEDGMARMYIYGSKITDTVRVIPSDYGVRSHSGYDKTAGKIPNEDDPMYEFFAMDPYIYTKYDEEEQEEVVHSASNISVLQKLPSGNGILDSCFTIKKMAGMSSECVRYTKEQVLQNANKNFPYPYEKGKILYGQSDAKLSKKFDCKCINGKYHIDYKYMPIDEYIQVMLSGWKYKSNDWKEYCWNRRELQSTYDHETLHIDHMRASAENFYLTYFKKTIFDTENKCMEKGDKQLRLLHLAWGLWRQDEKNHGENRWEDKAHGGYREGTQCAR